MTHYDILSTIKNTMNLFVFHITIKHCVTGFKVQATTRPFLFMAKINFSTFSIIRQVHSKKQSKTATTATTVKVLCLHYNIRKYEVCFIKLYCSKLQMAYT